jgi:hypothetical protein
VIPELFVKLSPSYTTKAGVTLPLLLKPETPIYQINAHHAKNEA